MRATRFPARASGPAERVAGFVAHLRLNGLASGPAETARALEALGAVRAKDPGEARLALRAALAGSAEEWRRFDGLFDAYWSMRADAGGGAPEALGPARGGRGRGRRGGRGRPTRTRRRRARARGGWSRRGARLRAGAT